MSFLKQLVDMYESGASLKDIGHSIGHSHQYFYRKALRLAIPLREARGSGPKHSQWKGGRLEAGQGYWRVWVGPDDPMASMRDHQGYVKEHRLVLARAIGRPLRATETVHHVNGIKDDNREENLQLRQGRHGKGVGMCCLDCGSQRIGPTVISVH